MWKRSITYTVVGLTEYIGLSMVFMEQPYTQWSWCNDCFFFTYKPGYQISVSVCHINTQPFIIGFDLQVINEATTMGFQDKSLRKSAQEKGQEKKLILTVSSNEGQTSEHVLNGHRVTPALVFLLRYETWLPWCWVHVGEVELSPFQWPYNRYSCNKHSKYESHFTR